MLYIALMCWFDVRASESKQVKNGEENNAYQTDQKYDSIALMFQDYVAILGSFAGRAKVNDCRSIGIRASELRDSRQQLEKLRLSGIAYMNRYKDKKSFNSKEMFDISLYSKWLFFIEVIHLILHDVPVPTEYSEDILNKKCPFAKARHVCGQNCFLISDLDAHMWVILSNQNLLQDSKLIWEDRRMILLSLCDNIMLTMNPCIEICS